MSEDRRQSSEDGRQMTEVREYGIWNSECGLWPGGADAPEGWWKYSISDCGMDTLRASGINPFPQTTNQPINNLTNI